MDSRVFAALLAGLLLGALCGYALFYFAKGMEGGERAQCINGSISEVFSPGAEEEVAGLIRSAEKSVYVEMYLFSYSPLADELIKAQGRGVDVRVILEPRLSGDNANLDTMERLRGGGVAARWASLEYKLTHTKAMVVDGKRVLVGSTNWSASAMKKNREYSVLIEDEGVAAEFEKNFLVDWDKATGEREAE